MWQPGAVLRASVDAALFCLGYAAASSLLVTGQSAVSIVDPRIFAAGTFNARLVVVLSVSAGLIAVVTWRSAYHLRWRRQ
jgi:hypothetical protein